VTDRDGPFGRMAANLQRPCSVNESTGGFAKNLPATVYMALLERGRSMAAFEAELIAGFESSARRCWLEALCCRQASAA